VVSAGLRSKAPDQDRQAWDGQPPNGGAKEFAQIPPIFLPFSKTDAVESAASEEMDNIIEARELQIERKHFYVELRENERGRFLRITEEAHGRRNSIIVPSTGVDDFTATIAEVLTNNEGAPA
jgi:PurA ssDNA and RNA-binding protein